MKHIAKIFFAIFFVTAFGACDKINVLPHYANGTVPTLTASKTSVIPAASDSNNTVLTLNWSNPKYGTDSAHQKFIIQVDSSGRNFSSAVSFEVDGPLSYSFTGANLNTVLANFGFTAGNPFNVDMRVTSSYANNNQLYQSNVVTVTITPYVVPIALTPSSSTAVVLQVNNATGKAIGFNWTPTSYGNNNINYALQLDTVGGNFAQPQTIKYGTGLSSSITVNDLNSAAIAAGVSGGSTKNIEFRIVGYTGTTYANPLVYSNTVNISVTTFTPIPPTLYIVGDATPGGWSNPVPVPSQQFTRLDDVSYGIVVSLTAGKSYLFLPVNGDWTHKYGGASASGGPLLADNSVPGSNTPAPATSGMYQIVVNFQTGTYTVTPFTMTIPDNLYIVGDATAGGWNNPVPVPSQQFTRIDAVTFGIIVDLTAGKSYLLLPVNGIWDHKYGGASATGGTLLADGAVPGSNTPAPATSGTYQILVNFQTGQYSVTPYTGTVPVPQNLYIVGDATAGGWNNPVPVPSQQFTRVNLTDFQLTVSLSSTGSYLFLPLNGNWDHKYGGASAAGGPILYDVAIPGTNTPAPATSGNYLIDVNFATGKYTVTKQ